MLLTLKYDNRMLKNNYWNADDDQCHNAAQIAFQFSHQNDGQCQACEMNIKIIKEEIWSNWL